MLPSSHKCRDKVSGVSHFHGSTESVVIKKVSRYSGAVHRSFTSRREAEDWLSRRSSTFCERILRNAEGSIALQPSSVTKSRKRMETVEHPQNTPNSNHPQGGRCDVTPPALQSDIRLSPEQKSVLNQVRQGRSVFFTGSAGQLPCA